MDKDLAEYVRADLIRMREAPLEEKVARSKDRIREWYRAHDGKVYVAFSGGKDSTVVLSLVRSMYPDVPAVFSDTGLEYPEIKEFVRSTDNVVVIRPRMSFRQVVDRFGYAVPTKRVAGAIGKVRRNGPDSAIGRYHLTGYTRAGKFSNLAIIPKKWLPLLEAPFMVSDRCCDVLKKQPFYRYEKETGRAPITGEMAADSLHRRAEYLRHGCNVTDTRRPISRPISVWREEDVWEFLRVTSTPYSSIYDMGYSRTGCAWCLFGVHLERGDNRLQLLEKTHPHLHKYCTEKMGIAAVCDYIGVPWKRDKKDGED